MGTTYYVNGSTGNDNNTGLSEGQAWKTLTKASNAAAAGSAGNLNTILIAPGTYSKQAIKPKNYQEWKRHGDSGVVVIDGGYNASKEGTAPDSSTFNSGMIQLSDCTGSIVDGGTPYAGIRVQNGGGNLIVLAKATNCVIRNVKATFCYKGILNADRVNGTTVEYCRLEWGNRQEHHGGGQGSGPAGVQVNALFKRSGTIYFRYNILCNSHGEGVGWANDSGLNKPWGLRMHNNVLFNMSHMHFVANHGHYADVYNNFFFHTNDPEFRQNNSGDPPAGFMISDENGRDADGYKRATNIRAWNNVIAGFSDGLNVRISTKSSSACRNFYFGFNTIVNCKTNSPSKNKTFGMRIPAALSGDPHTNSLIEHNIVINSITNLCNTSGITYRKNLFFNSPNSPSGNNNFVANPMLVNNNYVPSGIGDNITWDVTRLALTGSSPAINAALARQTVNNHMPPAEPYQTDYFGNGRNSPDLGAMEFGGTVVDSVTASFTATPQSGVAPLEVAFDSSGSSETGNAEIDEWDWDFDDGDSSSDPNPTHEFEEAGAYDVSLTVRDSGLGLEDTSVMRITVTEEVTADKVTASFTRTPASGFAPLSVSCNSSGSSAEGAAVIDRYEWNFGDGAGIQSTVANPVHQYTEAGTFTITLTVRDTALGLSSTATRTVTVSVVEADFTQSATGGQAPLTVSFTDTSQGDIDEWDWDFGDGSPHSTEQNPSHTYQQGVWVPRLTVRNAAADVSSTKVGATIIVGQQDTGSGGNVVIKRLRQALSTSTGLQHFDFSLGDLVPTFVMFVVSGGTSVGTARAGARLGIGCATVAGEFAGASYSQDGQATSVAARRWKRGACVLLVDETGAVVAEATRQSFSSNRVTINITTAPDQAYLVEAVAIAGSGAAAYIGTLTPGAQGNLQALEEAGFEPNIFLAPVTGGPEDTALTDAEHSIGFAAIADGELKQYVVSRRDYHNQADTALKTMLQEGRVLYSRDGTPNGRASAAVMGFLPGGISFKEMNDAYNYLLPYVVLRLETEIAAGFVVLPTSGSPDAEVLANFGSDAPQFLMLVLNQTNIFGSQVVDRRAGTIGLYVQDSSGAGSVTVTGEDAEPTTDTQSLAANNLVIPDDDGTDDAVGSVALSAGQFAITLTTNPATAIAVPYLAVKSTAAAAPTTPEANFTSDITHGFIGTPVRFFNLSAGNGSEILSVLWDFGDGNSSTEENPTHIYRDAGEFTVSLTVTTAVGEDTRTVEGYITIEERTGRRVLVGPFTPLAVTEDSEGLVGMDPDEESWGTISHTLALRALPLASDVDEVLAARPDVVLLQYDAELDRYVVVRPDSSLGEVGID